MTNPVSKVSYSLATFPLPESVEATCIICTEELSSTVVGHSKEPGETGLQCFLHRTCLLTWVKQKPNKPNCPFCRISIDITPLFTWKERAVIRLNRFIVNFGAGIRVGFIYGATLNIILGGLLNIANNTYKISTSKYPLFSYSFQALFAYYTGQSILTGVGLAATTFIQLRGFPFVHGAHIGALTGTFLSAIVCQQVNPNPLSLGFEAVAADASKIFFGTILGATIGGGIHFAIAGQDRLERTN